MADRVRELAAVVAEEYGGDASRIWSEARRHGRPEEAARLAARLRPDEGHGARRRCSRCRYGVKTAKPLVPDHPCLGDVDSPEALADYQASKRAHKAALRAR